MLGSGASFAVFMLGGGFLALVVIPSCRLLGGDAVARYRRVQRVISRSFRLQLWFMRVIGVVKKGHFRGLEHLASGGPFLIVANHPTLIDVVLLISRLPEVDCVVKRALWEHPFLGGVVQAANYIQGEGTAFMECALERLRLGHSIILFPEGTRSPRRGLRPFQRGAARLALASEARIVPVVIRCEPPFLMKGQPWWDVPDRPLNLSLQFGAPDEIPLPEGEPENGPLGARALTDSMEHYFRSKMTYVGA
jgi:1-acyl-sn-glycerol-3-phosphate acyltransferase